MKNIDEFPPPSESFCPSSGSIALKNMKHMDSEVIAASHAAYSLYLVHGLLASSGSIALLQAEAIRAVAIDGSL